MTPDEREDLELYVQTAQDRAQVAWWCLRIACGLLAVAMVLGWLVG
jgi:hypothetical protein